MKSIKLSIMIEIIAAAHTARRNGNFIPCTWKLASFCRTIRIYENIYVLTPRPRILTKTGWMVNY